MSHGADRIATGRLRAGSSRITRAITCLAAVLAVELTWLAAQVTASEQTAPSAASALSPASPFDSPLADPIVRAPALLKGDRATVWSQDDQTQYLLLDKDALFKLGAYGFQADRAVVRIQTQQKPGQHIYHLAIYLDQARQLYGSGPVSAQGPRLLVTASSAGEPVSLETNLLTRVQQPPADPFIEAALQRFARHDQTLMQATLPAPTTPLWGPEAEQARQARREQIRQQQRQLLEARLPASELEPAPATIQAQAPADASAAAARPPAPPAPAEPPAPATARTATAEAPRSADRERERPAAPPQGILPTRGTVSFHADRIVFEQGQDEDVLMLVGGVRLIYQEEAEQAQAPPRVITLQAERAVVFTDPRTGQAVSGADLPAQTVRGVYLEDNVIASDGQYTIRAPRVYYDVQRDKAILLEAVLYTYDIKRQIPLYMRADLVRQTSRTSFEARDAILTTSEFAQPHFAIGAGRLTLKQIEQEEGGLEQRFTATHTTFNVLGVPTFYWPFLAGQTNDVPLRRISAGYSNQTGPEVTTRWDLFALAGRQRPENVDMLLALDYLGDHGPGTGVELEYDRDAMFGRLDSYLLPNDNGEDDIGGRPIEIEHDGETRGFFRWQHRHELAQGWELSLEGAYVSDETFLEEFFRDEAYEAKPYETSLYLKKQQDEWAADLLASVQTTDFLPQLTTLQTPGYAVEKLPELRYFRMGTSLWDGRLTWFSENRISRVRADFGEDAPEDRGFSNSASQLLFGIPATTTFEDAADAMMFPDDWRWRADTRQEITAPMKLGILDVVPYAAGRITAYDEDFEEFSGQDDQARLWGAVGTRFHTTFTSQANDFESQILDVHRLRHIIEPSVDVFLMGSTVSASDLPVYDTDVESVSEGSGVRLGLLNTWQTQRGGPGRWRSVDWITLQTDLVLRSSDADTDAAIARFYPYRPEYGIGQDHFYTQLMWMVSDTLGVVGELTYNLQGDEGVAHWRLGATLQHTPRLNSFLNYEEIDILDSRLLTYGFTYQLTTKYTLSFAQRWDLGQRESRDLSVWLERKLPRWRFRVVASIDELDDEQMIGVVLVPEGITGGVSPIRLIEPSRN